MQQKFLKIFIPTNHSSKALNKPKIADAIRAPNSLNPNTFIHTAMHHIAKGGLELYTSGFPNKYTSIGLPLSTISCAFNACCRPGTACTARKLSSALASLITVILRQQHVVAASPQSQVNDDHSLIFCKFSN